MPGLFVPFRIMRVFVTLSKGLYFASTSEAIAKDVFKLVFKPRYVLDSSTNKYTTDRLSLHISFYLFSLYFEFTVVVLTHQLVRM